MRRVVSLLPALLALSPAQAMDLDQRLAPLGIVLSRQAESAPVRLSLPFGWRGEAARIEPRDVPESGPLPPLRLEGLRLGRGDDGLRLEAPLVTLGPLDPEGLARSPASLAELLTAWSSLGGIEAAGVTVTGRSGSEGGSLRLDIRQSAAALDGPRSLRLEASLTLPPASVPPEMLSALITLLDQDGGWSSSHSLTLSHEAGRWKADLDWAGRARLGAGLELDPAQTRLRRAELTFQDQTLLDNLFQSPLVMVPWQALTTEVSAAGLRATEPRVRDLLQDLGHAMAVPLDVGLTLTMRAEPGPLLEEVATALRQGVQGVLQDRPDDLVPLLDLVTLEVRPERPEP